MPIYELECDYCGLRSEHHLGMNDSLDDWLDCPQCTGKICRRHNRIYSVPTIQGDTVAGGCSYEYFDDGLGEYVKSKKHRKELMKEKGLTEYNPDPELQKHRDEAMYIRKNSNIKEPGALAAVRKEHKTAADKRRDRIVKKTFSKALGDSKSQ
jgi:putative FmdB family regulatory protein